MKFLKNTQIVFAGIAVGPILFLAVILYMQYGKTGGVSDYDDPVLYASIGFSTFAVIASYMIYKLRLPAVKQTAGLNEKLRAWQVLLIIRAALIEGACLFNIVCLLVKEYDIFLYIATALIALQFMNFPTRQRVKSDLELSEEEVQGI